MLPGGSPGHWREREDDSVEMSGWSVLLCLCSPCSQESSGHCLYSRHSPPDNTQYQSLLFPDFTSSRWIMDLCLASQVWPDRVSTDNNWKNTKRFLCWCCRPPSPVHFPPNIWSWGLVLYNLWMFLMFTANSDLRQTLHWPAMALT